MGMFASTEPVHTGLVTQGHKHFLEVLGTNPASSVQLHGTSPPILSAVHLESCHLDTVSTALPAPGSKMLSGKVEKRIASSVYITLAPPKRDMVSKVDTRPEVHQQRSDPPTEATKSVRTQQPQVSPPRKTPTSSHQAGQASSSAGPSCGATGSSSAGFSTFPCPVLPDIPTGSDLESPLPSPPDPLLSSGLDALSAETLCPDLQTLNLSSPVNQQSGWGRDCLSLHMCSAQLRGATTRYPNQQQPRCQASSSTPEELRQHKIQATNLEQADERQVLKRNMNGHLERDISTVCAFCHKALGPQTVAIEAMNKQYHVDCFRCRTCHGQLAGQHYYQKEGRPMCNACYKDTLEKCAKCQAVILDHIVRALGNGYHPECFTCSVCCRSIGDGSFALDDQNEVHCVDDFYRKYASVCGACETPIVPQGGQDAYRIECLGRHFHETCYRCETCGVLLSPEPAENGCYPLESRIFCKSCHIKQKNESFC
ncbi:filamin-binding LIM protein 1 isoform X3 [Pelodiscus sinensis]|uniref:filamin-binding LIM protein 1 isoform X3 n=1 Tax=Pelodiscus sinensis TaxID=13735 RepID=UPI003F6B4273